MENNKPFFNKEDIPTPEDNPEFWAMIDSPHFKNNINFLILVNLRNIDPSLMNDTQCRVAITKLRTYVELMDSSEAFKNAIHPNDPLHEEDHFDPPIENKQ